MTKQEKIINALEKLENLLVEEIEEENPTDYYELKFNEESDKLIGAKEKIPAIEIMTRSPYDTWNLTNYLRNKISKIKDIELIVKETYCHNTIDTIKVFLTNEAVKLLEETYLIDTIGEISFYVKHYYDNYNPY